MEKDIASIKIVLGVFLTFMLVYLMNILSTIMIPLTLAIFIALLMQTPLQWLKDKKIPYAIGVILILGIITLIFTGIGQVIVNTGNAFYNEKDKLASQIEVKLQNVTATIERIPGIDFHNTTLQEVFKEFISMDWILQSTKNIAGTVGNITSLIFMVLIFLIAMLGGIIKYKTHLRYLTGGSSDKANKAIENFEKIKDSIFKYIKVKTVISLATGIGFWFVCFLFGIDFAVFWGFLAFLLNFIPTVGSIVATVPPVLLGLIQISGDGSLLFFALCLIGIQIIFGNILEPKIMGSALALNMATIIIGLLFWGYLWGVTGMILSVPLMVLIKVILSQFPSAAVIVRMMGDPPELKEALKNDR